MEIIKLGNRKIKKLCTCNTLFEFDLVNDINRYRNGIPYVRCPLCGKEHYIIDDPDEIVKIKARIDVFAELMLEIEKSSINKNNVLNILNFKLNELEYILTNKNSNI